MRRLVMWALILAVVLCVGYAPAAVAEAADVSAVALVTDLVGAVVVAIGAALAFALAWLTYKYVIPWVKTSMLGKFAAYAVEYAEVLIGRDGGAQKLEIATDFVVDRLARIGIKVDGEGIYAAIVAAWSKLNLAQIAAGIKDAAGTKDAIGAGATDPAKE